MKDDIYTIKRLCKELNQSRQKIRRRLINLNIKATNEDTRSNKNDPLEYDYQSFIMLEKEFKISVTNKECTANEQQYSADKESFTNEKEQRTTDDLSKDKLIKVLEEQLKESNASRANLERLLDQQQQLTLMSNRELEALKSGLVEIQEAKVSQEEKVEDEKRKWYDFLRKKR